MTAGYATYEIRRGNELAIARFFLNEADESGITDLEREVADVVCDGLVVEAEKGNDIGLNSDPYKIAESILANHYGYAQMVEAHYEWKPGIIY